jgi:hypothetical protein
MDQYFGQFLSVAVFIESDFLSAKASEPIISIAYLFWIA